VSFLVHVVDLLIFSQPAVFGIQNFFSIHKSFSLDSEGVLVVDSVRPVVTSLVTFAEWFFDV
jgi:hypothetical protein